MKKTTLITLIASLTLCVTSVSAYDTELAQKMDNFYEKMTFVPLSKSTLFVTPEQFADEVKKDSSIVLLDIRTPQEQAFIRSGYTHTLEIPLEELFKAKNLDRLPTDKRIIVFCHSGTRATPAALNLKMLGFKNVQVLQNGIVGLAQISSPKTCILK